MGTIKKHKALLLCFMSLLFMAGMCEEDPDIDFVSVESISLDYTSKSLKVGETFTLAADVAPENASNISLNWSSNDEDVAIVKSGKVTAMAPGKATITAAAKDGSGVSASCVVTVSENVYTPVEAKNKLEAVGLRFVNTINAETHQNLVEVMDYFANNFEDFDLSDAYYEKLEDMYVHEHEEMDYARRRNPVVAMAKMTMECLSIAHKGAQMSTRMTEVCNWAYMINLPGLFGGFTPDFENEEWAYDASVNDRVELSFTDDKNQKWVATVKGSEKTTRIHISVYDKYANEKVYEGGDNPGTVQDYASEYSEEYTIDVPENITFTVTCNGNAIVELNVSSSLALDVNYKEESKFIDYYIWSTWSEEWWSEWYDYETSQWVEGWVTEWYSGYVYNTWDDEGTYSFNIDYSNLNMDAALKVNGYEESFKAEVTKSGVAMNAEVKIDGVSMLKASGSVNADVDALISDANEEEFKARNIKDIKMKVDVLGEVQVDAECANFKNLYDAAQYLVESEDVDKINSWVDEVNNAYKAKMCFDNSSIVQAIFELEAEVEEEYDYTSTYFYPVMVFAANGSRYSLDDYFTESAFSDLIDAVENLAEQFEELYEDYFEEEAYPDYH